MMMTTLRLRRRDNQTTSPGQQPQGARSLPNNNHSCSGCCRAGRARRHSAVSSTMNHRRIQRPPPPPRILLSAIVTLTVYCCCHSDYCSNVRMWHVQALSVTTFNVLAAVHRSVPMAMVNQIEQQQQQSQSSSSSQSPPLPSSLLVPLQQVPNRRESERRDWWQPRAEGLAQFVAKELASSDVVLLQEWWFGQEFQEIFDHYTGDIFDRVAEQRPGPGRNNALREDGMAVLVKKKQKGGKLELLGSTQIRTGPQRIAQIVQCREVARNQNIHRESGGENNGRMVLLGNAHLSFPGGPDAVANERRQAYEVHLLARAMSREGRRIAADTSPKTGAGRGGHLQILAGDFNSNSRALASQVLESTRHYNFVNCMSAHAEQNLNSIGGPVNTGVTHRTHRGEDVSVDQIFARLMNEDGLVSKTSLRRLGGPAGTYVMDCRKRHLQIEGETILSDHMPVTMTLHWPTTSSSQRRNNNSHYYYNPEEMEHPLESPWGS